MGASDDGAGNQSCVVTLVPHEGTGLVYTPEIATAANATSVRIINGGVDVNTGLYPPHGSYDIILTNDDGSYDIVKKGFHYGPGPWS